MFPCGNCRETWAGAVLDLMRGPSKLSRDQAEARLEAMIEHPGTWIDSEEPS